ncbi:MAG: hypothetical protein H6652_12025 [Ardenticatenaceae bacterium]|nr:hypothetical protein [Ardenticatenaceae bacterium]
MLDDATKFGDFALSEAAYDLLLNDEKCLTLINWAAQKSVAMQAGYMRCQLPFCNTSPTLSSPTTLILTLTFPRQTSPLSVDQNHNLARKTSI